MEGARKLLVETRVKALGALSSANLVQLLDTSTVEQALQVLAEYHILSAPVVAPGDDGQAVGVRWPAQLPNSDIMGFVCVNDVLTSFLEYYSTEVNGAASASADATASASAAGVAASGGSLTTAGCSGNGGNGSMLARMRRLEGLGLKFAQQQLRNLSCKGCDGDFLHSRHAGEATLLELVMYGFLDPKRRGMHEGEQQAHVVHRVALFDRSGAITAVISQTDICRFLADNMGRLGGLAGRSMAQLGWACKPVVCCTPETPALDAMRLMVGQGVSSLAVVAAAGPGGQPAGRLLGNFSASEMRSMTSEHFGALSLPVGEFLAMEHDTEYVLANREKLLEAGVLGSPAHLFITDRSRRARPHSPGQEVGQQLIVATADTTFAEVVTLIVQHRIHRVYVVDGAEVPVGIVTCTDILRQVVEEATQAVPPSPTAAAAVMKSPRRGAEAAAAEQTATA